MNSDNVRQVTKEEFLGLFGENLKQGRLMLQEKEDSTHTVGCSKSGWEKISAFIKSFSCLGPPQIAVNEHKLSLTAATEAFEELMKADAVPVPTSVCNFFESARTQLRRHPTRERHILKLSKETADWLSNECIFPKLFGDNYKTYPNEPNLPVGSTIVALGVIAVGLYTYKLLWGSIKRSLLASVFGASEGTPGSNVANNRRVSKRSKRSATPRLPPRLTHEIANMPTNSGSESSHSPTTPVESGYPRNPQNYVARGGRNRH